MPSPKVLAACKEMDETFSFSPQESERLSPTEPLLNFLRREDLKPELFDYQIELKDLSLSLIDHGARGMVSLPTGGGKTRTAVAVLLDAMESGKVRRAVWLAPTLELLDQAHKTIVQLWRQHGTCPDLYVSKNSSKAYKCSVWLTTPAAINLGLPQELNEWDLVIFDEAHQMKAETYAQAVNSILGNNPKAALIGLTATPGRTAEDEIEALASLFNNNLLVSKILGTEPVKFMQDRGVLARLDFDFVPTLDSSHIKNRHSQLLRILELCKKRVKENSKILVFAKNLSEAEALTLVLNHQGVKAWFIEGRTPEDQRRKILHDFSNCSQGVLVNQKLLATGYDCPAVTDVVLGYKVGSPILFEQMVGRVARGPRTGGTRRAKVWEFDSHLEMHGEPQAYIRFKDEHWGNSTL